MSTALLRRAGPQLAKNARQESTSAVQQHVTYNPATASFPVIPFVDGIPAVQARALTQKEKDWKFWSTSDYGKSASASLITVVPPGERWIVESGGRFAKIAEPGLNILIPGVHKIRAVKSSEGATLGVVARNVKSRDGDVDAYAVIYTGYADLAKSAFGANGTDGEVELANFASKALGDIVRDSSSKLSSNDRTALGNKLVDALKAKASDLGLDIKAVEIRDLYPSSADVPSRLVALEPAPRAEWDHTHRLKNDYWADKILPEFFTKFRFGNAREPENHATTGLEWSLPSPPAYHHYGAGIPKMTVLPPGSSAAH